MIECSVSNLIAIHSAMTATLVKGSMHPPRIRENRERCRVPIAKPSSRPKFQTAFPREARAESRAGKPRTTTTPVASQGCGVQSWTLASALSIAAGQLYGVGNAISLMTVTTTCSGRRTSGGHIVIDHANDKTRPGIGDIPQRERRPAPSLSRLQAYRDS